MIRTRIFAVLFALSMVVSAAVMPASAAESVTEVSKVSGSDYTDSALLAKALNEIFAGDIDLYVNAACTREKNAPLGSSPMTGGAMYWVESPVTGGTISGWQCYIYANAVYNKLFGEWIRHGDEDYARSEVVIGGGYSEVTYHMFAKAGVRCGAYMRTTAYSGGTYNGSAAHSLIILAYDADTITYLDGNSDGNGLVRINIRTWEDFNAANLSGRGRYTNHVIQPTAEYYEILYGTSFRPHLSAPDPDQLPLGDVSGNGRVDARDYMLLKLYVLGNAEFAPWQETVADVNKSGDADARDYIMVKCHVLGKYTIQ